MVRRTRENSLIIVRCSKRKSFIPSRSNSRPSSASRYLYPRSLVRGNPVASSRLTRLFTTHTCKIGIVFVSSSYRSKAMSGFTPVAAPPAAGSGSTPVEGMEFLPPNIFLSSRGVHGLNIHSHHPTDPPKHRRTLLVSNYRSARCDCST